MEILLLKDVKGLGVAGGVAVVSDGYARNFLIPKGLARFADTRIRKEIEKQKNTKKTSEDKVKAQMQKLAVELNGEKFELALPASKEGRLYAGLKKEEILSKIKETTPKLPDQAEIKNYSSIKITGEHDINVEVLSGIFSKIKLIIRKADA